LADPQSFNRYAYVSNDPVNFVDPNGLQGDALSEGLQAARDALSNIHCRNLFKGSGQDPMKLLEKYADPSNSLIQFGTTYSNGTPFEGDVGASTNTRTGVITINQNGFYMSGQIPTTDMISGAVTYRPITALVSSGFYGLQRSEIRGAVIIHELLHVAKAIPSDRHSSEISQLNASLVRINCFVLPNQPVDTAPPPPINIAPRPRFGRRAGDQNSIIAPGWMVAQQNHLDWVSTIGRREVVTSRITGEGPPGQP
jgi:hypothetical protein